jgi:ribosomal protein RSM22 (predicted rRNA methylase)
MERLFPPLTEEARRLMNRLPALVDRTFPMPRRFRSALIRNVAELSRLLTSGRGELRESYLGEGPFLAAYLRYFLPWNVYRLARLLPSLKLPLAAVSGGAASIIDLGSGPLTFPIALWISRPDLRTLSLEFRCLDRAAPALRAGKALFEALSGGDCPWKIRTVHASLGDPIRLPQANLVAAVNLFNELFWKLPRTDHGALSAFAEKEARLLSRLCMETGSVFVLEPGVPRCGEFLSLLREAFSARGRFPCSPCDHAGPCPLPGFSPSALRDRKSVV